MQCELLHEEGSEALFRMEFAPEVFEKRVVEEYRRLLPDDVRNPELVMLSTSALLGRCPKAVEVVGAAVQGLLKDNIDDAYERLGLEPLSDAQARPVSSEIDEPLVVQVKIEIAPSCGEVSYEGLHAVYDEVVPEGTEVELRLAQARLRYGVETDDALAEKMGLEQSAEEMKADVERSLLRAIDHLNEDAKRKAVEHALVEANPLDVSEDEVDRFVDEEVGKLRSQMGEQAFASQGWDENALRAMVRRDRGHVPHLNRLLTAIARQQDFKVSDEDRRREVERARGESVNPSALESVDETLQALKDNPEMERALDRQVVLGKALDLAVSKAVFDVHLQLSVREAAPHLITQW